MLGRVQIVRLDVQRYPPAARVLSDGDEQDLGPVLGEHAPQPAGVVMHPDLPDAGQRDRAWAVVVAHADCRGLVRAVLVAQPKRLRRTDFLLEAREPDSLAFSLTAARVRPGLKPFAEVCGGFLEYLLTHLGAPGQTRHHRVDGALGVDGEDPAGVFGFLPGIERVDQIEPGPRHVDGRIGLADGERRFHYP